VEEEVTVCQGEGTSGAVLWMYSPCELRSSSKAGEVKWNADRKEQNLAEGIQP